MGSETSGPVIAGPQGRIYNKTENHGNQVTRMDGIYTCPACDGHGVIEVNEETVICPECDGTGIKLPPPIGDDYPL